jgi:hypothetical protein
MMANVALYNRYARLIVHSFGLQRASDSRKTDLPSAFVEVGLPCHAELPALTWDIVSIIGYTPD